MEGNWKSSVAFKTSQSGFCFFVFLQAVALVANSVRPLIRPSHELSLYHVQAVQSNVLQYDISWTLAFPWSSSVVFQGSLEPLLMVPSHPYTSRFFIRYGSWLVMESNEISSPENAVCWRLQDIWARFQSWELSDPAATQDYLRCRERFLVLPPYLPPLSLKATDWPGHTPTSWGQFKALIRWICENSDLTCQQVIFFHSLLFSLWFLPSYIISSPSQSCFFLTLFYFLLPFYFIHSATCLVKSHVSSFTVKMIVVASHPLMHSNCQHGCSRSLHLSASSWICDCRTFSLSFFLFPTLSVAGVPDAFLSPPLEVCECV